MNDMTRRLYQLFDSEPAPRALERRRTARLRVALAGAGTCGESSTTKALRASRHWVTTYASAGALAYQLRDQPPSLDVIVLDCGADTDAIVPALELLRGQDDPLAIVLISDDDPVVLAQARRLSVKEVLKRPVRPVALLAAVARSASHLKTLMGS